MAEHAKLDRVESHKDFDGHMRHLGSWSALHAAGLVPSSMERPAVSRRGGHRWCDAKGNLCVLAGPREGGLFRVTEYPRAPRRRPISTTHPNRSTSIAFLTMPVIDEATILHRSFQHHQAPAGEPGEMIKARRLLAPLRDQLCALFPEYERDDPLYVFGPVYACVKEIEAKMRKRPEELHRSSKLYRAAQNLEWALAASPDRHGADVLRSVESELRRLSGWTRND